MLQAACDEIRLPVEFVTVGFLGVCRHSCCAWFPVSWRADEATPERGPPIIEHWKPVNWSWGQCYWGVPQWWPGSSSGCPSQYPFLFFFLFFQVFLRCGETKSFYFSLTSHQSSLMAWHRICNSWNNSFFVFLSQVSNFNLSLKMICNLSDFMFCPETL